MGRPAKVRPRRSVVQVYGSGIIAFGNVLKEELKRAGGELEAKVIREDAGDEKSALVYLLVYKDLNGEYFDVVQPSSIEQRIYKNADVLLRFVQSLREDLPELPQFMVPELTTMNLVRPGELAGSISAS